MKFSYERLVEDEMELLRKLNFIKNIKYHKEIINDDQREHDISVLFINDHIEVSFDMLLNYEQRNNIKFEIKSFKQISNPIELIQNFINNFEWKEGISYKDFFMKFHNDFYEHVQATKNLRLGDSSVQSTENSDVPSEIFSSKKYFLQITFLIHLISILFKIATGLYGYSGEGNPPRYGDYEAQRHWMELTLNLNLNDWYTNSTSNPSDYWPLDYPPVSGYYSLLWGHFFNLTIPESVAIKSSWGYESPLHKSLMRLTVLISDFIFFHIPVFILLSNTLISKNKPYRDYLRYYITSFLLLCSPLFIIIDHGHFQYNCVMHGLFILAVYFLYKKYFILAILSYALCINFKQMGFYYAFPFPFYVIKYLYDEVKHYNNKLTGLGVILLSILKYIAYTILFILLIWGPWIIYDHRYKDVLLRIFPIWRGIFEDKVATFWCTLNILYKIKNMPHNTLVISSLALTFTFCFISSMGILLYKKASKKITNLAFFNVSMSFFLFSFHVHEKTILIPYLAYLLNVDRLSEILPSFTMISLFSLHPLLKRENQLLPYFIFLIFSLITTKYFKLHYHSYKKEYEDGNKINIYIHKFFSLLEEMNMFVVIIYHYMELVIPPPIKYPWLYPTLNAAYSFLNFSLYFLYSNIKMIQCLFKKKTKID